MIGGMVFGMGMMPMQGLNLKGLSRRVRKRRLVRQRVNSSLGLV